MGNGWEHSADAWIEAMGDTGDWGREHVLDPLMLERVSARQCEYALDVGCGEGRFCRMLKAMGIPVVGIDPTEALLAQARKRDAGGDYRLASAEALPFPNESFDLVVSYPYRHRGLPRGIAGDGAGPEAQWHLVDREPQ